MPRGCHGHRNVPPVRLGHPVVRQPSVAKGAIQIRSHGTRRHALEASADHDGRRHRASLRTAVENLLAVLRLRNPIQQRRRAMGDCALPQGNRRVPVARPVDQCRTQRRSATEDGLLGSGRRLRLHRYRQARLLRGECPVAGIGASLGHPRQTALVAGRKVRAACTRIPVGSHRTSGRIRRAGQGRAHRQRLCQRDVLRHRLRPRLAATIIIRLSSPASSSTCSSARISRQRTGRKDASCAAMDTRCC